MSDEHAPSKKQKKAALTPSHCEIEGCTWEYKTQRHRIIPGRDGGKYKAGNVIALCPNHHFMADTGLLEAELLSEIVRCRYESGWPPNEEMQSMSSGEASGEVQQEFTGEGRPEADLSFVSQQEQTDGILQEPRALQESSGRAQEELDQ